MKPSRFFAVIIVIIVIVPLHAQEAYRQIVSTIEAESPRLSALRMSCMAQQEEARAETALADPELSFNYLWGSPSEIGKRWDLGVSQSFDFPTAYKHRNELKYLAINNAYLQFEAARKEVLLEAHQLCIEIAFADTLLRLSTQQTEMARQCLEAQTTLLQEGATTILQYNMAQRQYIECKSALAQLESERDAKVSELQAMVGDTQLAWQQLGYNTLPLEAGFGAASFDAWWQQVASVSPLMQYVDAEVTRAEKATQLAKDGWLPGFTVGYMSENTQGDTWRGLSFGLRLPVWNNRHRVTAARNAEAAAQLNAISQKQAFMAKLQGLFNRAQSQQQTVADLRQLHDLQGTVKLLKQSFEAGNITRAEYLSGFIEHLELHKSLLSAEREARLLWAELHSVE